MINQELLLLAEGNVVTATEGVPAPAPGAATPPPAGGLSSFGGLIPFVVIFVVMIFFMTRSQKKQQQKRQAMIDQITKGSRVMTSGGMYGTVIEVRDNSFVVEIADNVKVEFAKQGVSGVIDPANAAAVPAAK